jgi:hypothetical protein
MLHVLHTNSSTTLKENQTNTRMLKHKETTTSAHNRITTQVTSNNSKNSYALRKQHTVDNNANAGRNAKRTHTKKQSKGRTKK